MMTSVPPLLKLLVLILSPNIKKYIISVAGENVPTFAEFQRWIWVKALLLDIRLVSDKMSI